MTKVISYDIIYKVSNINEGLVKYMAKSKAGGVKSTTSSKGKNEVLTVNTIVAPQDSAINKLASTPSISGVPRCKICGHDIEFVQGMPALYEQEMITQTHKRCWAREQ